jgi:hypothetical protein
VDVALFVIDVGHVTGLAFVDFVVYSTLATPLNRSVIRP